MLKLSGAACSYARPYGKFMEAKPEERMNVLANLLGLVYMTLEAETKEQLREGNAALKKEK
jgi:hypothetical protein